MCRDTVTFLQEAVSSQNSGKVDTSPKRLRNPTGGLSLTLANVCYSMDIICFILRESCVANVTSLVPLKDTRQFFCFEWRSNIEYGLRIFEYIRIVRPVEYSNSNMFEYWGILEYSTIRIFEFFEYLFEYEYSVRTIGQFPATKDEYGLFHLRRQLKIQQRAKRLQLLVFRL